MNKKILPTVFSAFFLLHFTCGLSQDHDLIVTTKGDSIACRIDSITETHIYFEMKSQNHWSQTHIDLTDVSEHKRNAIDKKQFVFKSGSSIIESPRPAPAASIRDIQKNSVYVGMGTLIYSRMFPGNKVGITLGAGIFNFDGWGLLAESDVLLGGIKHFFEPGFMFLYSLEPEQVYSEDGKIVGELSPFGVTFRTGYRYQGPKGLLIRAAPNFIFFGEDFYVLPALSLGYSF